MYIYQYPKQILYYTGSATFFDDKYFDNDLKEGRHWKDSGSTGVSQIVTNPNGVIITGSGSGGFTATILLAWPNVGTASYGHATTWYGSTTLGRGVKHKVIGDYNYEVSHRYEQLAWPSERHIDNDGNTTTVLANGYFTGPPTYKTTGNKWAFTIKNKTSLVWSNFVTDITIVVNGPHTTQKSKPEHFLWVAGGTGNGVALGVGMCFYDFRADFDNSYGWYMYEHPNYRKLINSVKLSMDRSSEEYVISGKKYANVFSDFKTNGRIESSNFLLVSTYSHKEIKKAPATETVGYVWSIGKSTDTTLWKRTNEYGDDDEPWSIIDTEKTVGTKGVWTTIFAKGTFNAGADKRPVYTAITDDDGSYYLTTSLGRHDVGVGHTVQFKQGASASYSNIYGKLRAVGQSYRGITNLGGANDYYLTEYQQFGFIQRKHETSKRGYYFTDPDTVYKCATEVGTDFDVNTFLCHDATCIDIKRYANAQIFQTAKTYNNSLALATLKNPRNTSRAMRDTISLQSVQGYSTYQTEEMRIWDTRWDSAPIWGHPMYKKNEYGEDASYSYSGFTTTEVDQTATRLIPVTNTMHAENLTPMWYAIGAYKWFYNPYQNPNRI